MAYKDYQHLLGLSYVDGDQDCYGLIRRFYYDLYGISIKNWARPADAFHAGLDLLQGKLRDEGFEPVDDSLDRLQLGDLLLIRIGCKVANHTAVYVGNKLIIHHLLDKKSSEDSLSPAWKQRVLDVVRHPFVTEANTSSIERVDFIDIIPDHVKARHGIIKPLGS